MKKENYLTKPLIKIFVYGTLRKNNKLGYYMEGSKFLGYYYTRGQLMKSENDNVYIDFAYNQSVTIGELYLVNFFCLQRINHLEVLSGTFPKGYNLDVMHIWKLRDEKNFDFNKEDEELAFYYKWKNCSVKILSGNFNDDFIAIDELEKYIKKNQEQTNPQTILEYMQKKLAVYQSVRF
jgi:gamma-glutamylcyclotransferase (GGCT)/AIG2-like uncharacterized protein YtfP